MTWDALTVACYVSAATADYVRNARGYLARKYAKQRVRQPGRVTVLLTDALLAERGYVVPSPDDVPTIPTLAQIRERAEASVQASDCADWIDVALRAGDVQRTATRLRRDRLRQLAAYRDAHRRLAVHSLLGGVDRGLTLERLVRPRLLDLTGYETWTDRAQVADAMRAVRGAWWEALRELGRDDRCWERVGLLGLVAR